jgi:putative membrane protein
MSAGVGGWRSLLLWAALSFYAAGRICQLYADRLPTLAIVLLHVVPPALFALVHGGVLYGRKGIAVFAVLCLGVGGAMESLSLRSGFPFGHYFFTDVMGPKVFQLPVLLVLAYLGIGYVAWVVSLLILGYGGKDLAGVGVVAAPVVASFAMVAWDLSMEAAWSTVDRAWIWRDGGAFFGVPLSNFLGWCLTTYLFYQAFALYCRRAWMVPAAVSGGFWRAAVIVYATCAFGNVLIVWQPAPAVVRDATGKGWASGEILMSGAAISVAVMGMLALLAWRRVRFQFAIGTRSM